MKTRFLIASLAFVFCMSTSAVWAQMALQPEDQLNYFGIKAKQKAKAENSFYVKVYGFYGLLTPGGFGGQGAEPPTTYQYNSNNTSYTYRTKSSDYKVNKSFGTGLRVGGGIGIVLNDFINLGIDGEYILGTTATESYLVTGTSQQSGQQPTVIYSYNVHKDYTYRIVNIIPNITFKAVSKPEYYIYNRLGVCIGIPTELSFTNTQSFNYPDAPTSKYSYQTSNTLDKGIGLGYQAALGIQFRIGDNLRGFTEVVVSNLQLKSSGSDITGASYTSTDSQFPENDKINEPVEVDPAQKRTDGLNLRIPVSSIGVGAGLVFRF